LFSLEIPSSQVRLLPYALVPGISLNSPIFIKALSTIAKQQSTALSAPVASSSKGKKKKVSTGMFSFSFRLFQNLIN